MQVVAIALVRTVSAVEADDVVVLIFHPDPAHKTDTPVFSFRLNVNHDAADFAQKLAAYKREVIIFALEILVDYHHLGKAQRQKLHAVNTGELGDEAASKSRLALEYAVFGAIRHVNPAQEILIAGGNYFAVCRFEVLDVSLNQRVKMAHLGHEIMLALDHLVDDVVGRERSGSGRRHRSRDGSRVRQRSYDIRVLGGDQCRSEN